MLRKVIKVLKKRGHNAVLVKKIVNILVKQVVANYKIFSAVVMDHFKNPYLLVASLPLYRNPKILNNYQAHALLQ